MLSPCMEGSMAGRDPFADPFADPFFANKHALRVGRPSLSLSRG